MSHNTGAIEETYAEDFASYILQPSYLLYQDWKICKRDGILTVLNCDLSRLKYMDDKYNVHNITELVNNMVKVEISNSFDKDSLALLEDFYNQPNIDLGDLASFLLLNKDATYDNIVTYLQNEK